MSLLDYLSQYLNSQIMELRRGSTQKRTYRNQEQDNNRPYQFIPQKTREQLIQLVVEEKISTYMAAQTLHINYSTAKAIIKNFRNNGHVFRIKQPANPPSRKNEPNRVQVSLESPRIIPNVEEPTILREEKVPEWRIYRIEEYPFLQSFNFFPVTFVPNIPEILPFFGSE